MLQVLKEILKEVCYYIFLWIIHFIIMLLYVLAFVRIESFMIYPKKKEIHTLFDEGIFSALLFYFTIYVSYSFKNMIKNKNIDIETRKIYFILMMNSLFFTSIILGFYSNSFYEITSLMNYSLITSFGSITIYEFKIKKQEKQENESLV